MIKMIVMDLDGTLLKKDKTISEKTKSVLNKYRKNGVKIVYATGRGGNAERVAPNQLFDGKITMNGAIANVDNKIVYKKIIPFINARPLLVACNEYGLKTTSEISEMHYTNFVTSDIWPNIINYCIVDFSQHEIDAEKLYAIINNNDDVLFIKNNLPKGTYLTVSKDGLAQVMNKEATKSKAVIELARIWNIEQSEIIAFGDDLNDIDMLAYAGIGIAMENAVDEVKAIAKDICPSNNEDGIAHWLENNINF
jgi:Cof subfamily protein (haloacid dehalogenase superfamily)